MKNLKKIEGVADTQNSSSTTIYRVNITQFELSKLLYESEMFSRIELTASSKLFLWALCSHYNPNNETMFPAQATVAKRLGMSARSAERAVKELREKGLVQYVTKRVNHYVFSGLFFELVGLKSSEGPLYGNLSGEFRQNVGCEFRQNVGLTNNHEQRSKKGNFIFLKGVEDEKRQSDKVLRYNNWKYPMPQKEVRSTPSVEETKVAVQKLENARSEAVSPWDFDREQAVAWLSVADKWFLKRSKMAQHLVEKYDLKEFQAF